MRLRTRRWAAAGGPALNPYLAAALAAIEEAAGDLPAAVLVQPVEGKWSIAEILEHLALAFRANTAALEKCLVSGELRARTPGVRQALGRMLVVDVGYFPRVEAPQMTRPTGGASAASLVSVREALPQLDQTLTRVADRFGTRLRVANHPYFGGLTVPQWQKFHWRHTCHHAAQIRQRRTSGVRA